MDTITDHRQRLIFHGSIVIMAGLILSLLAIVGIMGEKFQGWSAAHFPLMATGIWMLAMAAIFPLLILKKNEFTAILRSLLATGYGLMIATPIEMIIGNRAIEPAGPATHLAAFFANTIILLGTTLAVLLTLKGSRAALKR